MKYRVKVVPVPDGYMAHVYCKSFLLWSKGASVFGRTVETAAFRAGTRIHNIEFDRINRRAMEE